jgi:FkbH-like protein
MTRDRDARDAALEALAQKLDAQAGAGALPAGHRLRQAFERLVHANPRAAVAVLEAHAEEIAQAASDAGNLLLRTLVERKSDDEALRLVNLARGRKLVTDAAACVRLAKSLEQRGNRDAAMQVLADALAIDPACLPALRALYEIAAGAGDREGASHWLGRLAEADVGYPTASYVYRERQKLPRGPGRAVRIAILSSYVLDWLVPYLDAECRKAGLEPAFHVAPFNQYSQQVLNAASELYRFEPDVVFLALGLEDVCPQALSRAKGDDLEGARRRLVEEMLGLVEAIESNSKALMVLHDFYALGRDARGILQNRLANGLADWLAALNGELARALRARARSFLMPLDAVLGWVGHERSHHPKTWHMGSMRIGDAALPELARYSMRYVKALMGLTKKCVVLDLDGTLWGGIVGEGGAEGIALGPTAPGIEYVEFQRALLDLTRRGVLLAVCSKNNPEDALPVIRSHPHMVLREEHFAAMRVNWNNKADNIAEIAEELNIGLDSLIFIDDNPNERELIRQLLPEVMTVELPRDPSLYRRMLEGMPDFDLLALTAEDEKRAARYQANAKRRVERGAAASLDEYLRSLQIRAEIGIASPDALGRLVQMFNKTNQFNLTTRRYQAEDVTRFLQSDAHRVYGLRVADRFGDHGLVGTAVVRAEEGAWRIDSLLMSCRVMGLGVETAFLHRICADAAAQRVPRLVGEYVPTRKNVPVKSFYGDHGFALASDTDGRQEWALDVAARPVAMPSWIAATPAKVPA